MIYAYFCSIAQSATFVAMLETTTQVKPPAGFTESQKTKFVTLVREGGEVAGGLQDRIERAAFLVMIECAKTVKGVAALKRPNPNYRDRVFRKAGHSALANKFDFEIGWVFVTKDSRGEGLSSKLVKSALVAAGSASVFGTTRSDNLPMQHVLKKNGFKPCGNEYPSTQNPGSTLKLFVADKNSHIN